jgi:hypothetical protein
MFRLTAVSNRLRTSAADNKDDEERNGHRCGQLSSDGEA